MRSFDLRWSYRIRSSQLDQRGVAVHIKNYLSDEDQRRAEERAREIEEFWSRLGTIDLTTSRPGPERRAPAVQTAVGEATPGEARAQARALMEKAKVEARTLLEGAREAADKMVSEARRERDQARRERDVARRELNEVRRQRAVLRQQWRRSANRSPGRTPVGEAAAVDPTVPRLMLSPEQAATALGLSRARVLGLVADGSIASFMVGRSRRIPVWALEEFVEGLRGVTTAPRP